MKMRKWIIFCLLLMAVPMVAEETKTETETETMSVGPNEQYLLDIKKGVFPRHSLEVRIGDPLCSEWQGVFYQYKCDHWYGYENYEKADIWTGNYIVPTYVSGYALPAFSVAYHYSFRNWLQFGPTLSYSGYGNNYADKRTGTMISAYRNNMMNLMADVRFQYFDRRKVGIYSGVALGVGVGWEKETTKDGKSVNAGAAPAWQLTAFGLRAGDKVYFNMELGFGVEGFGQIGIGGRF